MIKLTKDQFDAFNNKVNNNKTYTFNEGDRIYVSDATSMRKRELDKYLKHTYNDIKRVSKIKKANVILDNLTYSYKSVISTDKILYVDFGDGDGLTKINWLGWSERELFREHCFKVMPKKDYTLFFSNGYYIENEDDLLEKYPRLYKYEYVLKLDESQDYGNIVNDLNNIPIYHYESVAKTVADYINSTRESTEDIDFSTIERLFQTNSAENAELAVTMMKGFDLRDQYVKLLVLFFTISSDNQKVLRKFLVRNPVFKSMYLPSSGTDYSHLHHRGFSHFKEGIKTLKNNNIEIDYNYLTKVIFEHEE